jgi:hypothetical protein
MIKKDKCYRHHGGNGRQVTILDEIKKIVPDYYIHTATNKVWKGDELCVQLFFKPTDMKNFNLKKVRQGHQVQTKNGKTVKILKTDLNNKKPIIGYYEKEDGSQQFCKWNEYGKISNNMESGFDLIMKPEKKEGWINIYRDGNRYCTGNRVYDTKEDAQHKLKVRGLLNRILDTVKIEWEE